MIVQPVVTPSLQTMAPAWDLARLGRLDPGAWEGLYHETRPTLWRFARNRLSSDDQAEDAVSEVMVRAMSAIGRYREGASGMIGWLCGIAHNVLHEMYRAGRRARSIDPRCEPAAAEPGDRITAAEEAHALRLAFADLPEPDQELLALRVVACLDAEATAKVLGRRPGAVRMAQSRALGRLRTVLREGDR